LLCSFNRMTDFSDKYLGLAAWTSQATSHIQSLALTDCEGVLHKPECNKRHT